MRQNQQISTTSLTTNNVISNNSDNLERYNSQNIDRDNHSFNNISIVHHLTIDLLIIVILAIHVKSKLKTILMN